MVKNNRLLILMISLITILSVFSIYVILTDDNEAVAYEPFETPLLFIKEDIEFNIEIEDYDAFDFIDKVIDYELSRFDTVDSIELNLTEYGEHKGTVSVSLNNAKITRSFTYSIIDEVPPIIIIDRHLTTPVGSPIDFNEYIRITDNALKDDEIIEPVIEGKINWDIPGSYRIRITAEDAAGNTASWPATVIVYSRATESTSGNTGVSSGGSAGSNNVDNTDSDNGNGDQTQSPPTDGNGNANNGQGSEENSDQVDDHDTVDPENPENEDDKE